MGWTGIPWFRDRYPGTTAKQFLDNNFSTENHQILKSTMRGSTYYGVCKLTKTNQVFAFVVLTSMNEGEFCYKEIEETMGPYQCECPVSYLKLLSPTDSKNALEWRRRVIEHGEFEKEYRLFRKGKSIMYAEEGIRYQGGIGYLKYFRCKHRSSGTGWASNEQNAWNVRMLGKSSIWHMYRNKTLKFISDEEG